MMHFVLMYWEAINQVTADKALNLRRYELDDNEWGIVGDLVSVLENYKKATIFFSQDAASVAAVIPAMDKLNSHLNPATKQPYHPAIQAAMKLARKKINHYYSMTDLSSAYRIAMGKCYLFISPTYTLTFVFSSPSWFKTRVLPTTALGRGVGR